MTRTETRGRSEGPGSERTSGASVSAPERRVTLEDLNEARRRAQRTALDALEDVVVPKLRELLADPNLPERDRALLEVEARRAEVLLERSGRKLPQTRIIGTKGKAKEGP